MAVLERVKTVQLYHSFINININININIHCDITLFANKILFTIKKISEPHQELERLLSSPVKDH